MEIVGVDFKSLEQAIKLFANRHGFKTVVKHGCCRFYKKNTGVFGGFYVRPIAGFPSEFSGFGLIVNDAIEWNISEGYILT